MGDEGYKIYVGNLSYEVEDEELKCQFSKYNVVEGKKEKYWSILRFFRR
jgi:RNA recognition motif-containing protein